MVEPEYVPPIFCLTFAVRDRMCALEQHGSAHLLPWLQRYTPPSSAPGLPDWCLGVLNVRGTVQLVVDLAYMLGFGPTEPDGQARLIFVEHGSAQVGLLVDREIGVRSVVSLDQPPEEPLPFQHGVGLLDGQPLALLDGAALIAHVAAHLRAPSYLAS